MEHLASLAFFIGSRDHGSDGEVVLWVWAGVVMAGLAGYTWFLVSRHAARNRHRSDMAAWLTQAGFEVMERPNAEARDAVHASLLGLPTRLSEFAWWQLKKFKASPDDIWLVAVKREHGRECVYVEVLACRQLRRSQQQVREFAIAFEKRTQHRATVGGRDWEGRFSDKEMSLGRHTVRRYIEQPIEFFVCDGWPRPSEVMRLLSLASGSGAVNREPSPVESP